MTIESQSFSGDLPDLVNDLLAMQKDLIVKLKIKNEVYFGPDEELNFLKNQNNVLKNQIDHLYLMMDDLCSERFLDNDMKPFGIA